MPLIAYLPVVSTTIKWLFFNRQSAPHVMKHATVSMSPNNYSAPCPSQNSNFKKDQTDNIAIAYRIHDMKYFIIGGYDTPAALLKPYLRGEGMPVIHILRRMPCSAGHSSPAHRHGPPKLFMAAFHVGYLLRLALQYAEARRRHARRRCRPADTAGVIGRQPYHQTKVGR